MRIEDAQQRFGDSGKFVVDLQMDARGEKREGFEHALDVRVFALIGLESRREAILGYLSANSAPIWRKKVSSRS